MKARQTERGYSFGFLLAKPTEEFNAITVDVSHSQGGMNYYNGKQNPKGHIYSLRPVKVNNNGSTSYMMFDGKSFADVLDNSARMNKKLIKGYIQTLFEQLRDKKGKHYEKIKTFYASHGIEL